jgi:hypothetical protein
MNNLVYDFSQYTIVSGGQTGADIAGLSAARTLGFKTGGWAPKGWITTDGAKQEELSGYGLKEHHGGYRERTIQNAKDSDITIIISRKWTSPGTILTMNACKKNKRPFIALRENGSIFYIYRLPELMKTLDSVSKVRDPDDMEMVERQLDEIAKLLKGYLTINVAGNAEDNAEGIEVQSFNLFYDIFQRLKNII